jgi:hypothetical protein
MTFNREAVYLDFLFSDSMRFVPMKLSKPFGTIEQTHPADTLQLTPSPSTMHFPYSRNVCYSAANGDWLYVLNCIDKLENNHESQDAM